jgi:hypothetical protein
MPLPLMRTEVQGDDRRDAWAVAKRTPSRHTREREQPHRARPPPPRPPPFRALGTPLCRAAQPKSGLLQVYRCTSLHISIHLSISLSIYLYLYLYLYIYIYI